MILEPQISNTILMVRPAHFGYNEETARNNAFQQAVRSASEEEIERKARQEFDAFVEKLRAHGVHVIAIEDTSVPLKNDAVFPNNWFSTHADGTLVTYPMFSEMRRLERRDDIIAQLDRDFTIQKIIRLENHEDAGRYLESTGSMILDRPNRLVYACRSIRTDEGLLDEFCRWMSYEKVIFEAYGSSGIPIYHTNVMMALGEHFCVICMDSIKDPVDRSRIHDKLVATGKEIIAIAQEQLDDFMGNMLQVEGEGQTFLVMSEQARQALRPDQVLQIERHTQILSSTLDTIEKHGGGSARCMMAEIYLPKKTAPTIR